VRCIAHWLRAATLATSVGALLLVAVSSVQVVNAASTAPQLHVSGNHLVNASGQTVVLHGVDRSGGEFACVQGWGIWDGPMDQSSIDAMKTWGISSVRVPLNEACWNAESYVNPAYAGPTYQQAVLAYVNLLNQNGIVAILDLHWSDGTYTGTSSNCSSAQATCQKPMPDAAQAVPFWTSVANTFKGNNAVIFDLFNEPYPEWATGSATTAWQCWLNGGTCSGIPYSVAGMQQLVNTVRSTGATNVIALGGLNYSNDLTAWLTYKPTDSSSNLVASWHSYDSQTCSSSSCWTSQIAPVAAQAPLLVGELGESDCGTGYIDSLTTWLDSQGASYLAWTWNNWDCSSAPSLISDYTGTATAYGAGYKAHLLALGSPTPLDHLVLSPTDATITTGGSQAYSAEGFDAHGNDLGDVTSGTTITIDSATVCPAHSCTSTTAGDHTVTGTDGSAHGTATLTITDVQGVISGTTYHAINPTRVLDTRNGAGGLSGPFTNHAARTFTVSGVPSNAAAVTGNLTVTGQTSSGYFFIGPVATNNPGSSTLNFPAGDDRANAVTVALGAGGTLSITFVAPSNGPTAQAIFDVTGYFTPDTTGATYHAISPPRALDTRNGTGGLSGPFTNHAARTFTVAGVPSGATAVTGNLTVTGQTSGGYLYIGPTAANNPTSSTLNFPVGDDRANAVTVQLGSSDTLSITFVGPINGQSAQAIFDVTGYFTADMTGAVYVPLAPTRLLDTRNGTGGLSGPFTNHAARTFTVAGSGGVLAGATAVTGNLTVTGQTSSGYLFISPTATNNPTSSTLNFPLGDDRANAVAVQLGAGGTLSITFVAPSNGPAAQAIFDVTGYFVSAGG
jgi:hypothetical protein